MCRANVAGWAVFVTKTKTNWNKVVKVIWRKAASPPHTDGSVVFTRWRQCAPHLVHPNRYPHRSDSACAESLWTYRPSIVSGHALGRPIFALKIAHSHVRSGPSSNTCFRVHMPYGMLIGSAVFAQLTVLTYRLTDRQTDHAYSAVSNNI